MESGANHRPFCNEGVRTTKFWRWMLGLMTHLTKPFGVSGATARECASHFDMLGWRGADRSSTSSSSTPLKLDLARRQVVSRPDRAAPDADRVRSSGAPGPERWQKVLTRRLHSSRSSGGPRTRTKRHYVRVHMADPQGRSKSSRRASTPLVTEPVSAIACRADRPDLHTNARAFPYPRRACTTAP